jgi:hypothetical protein
MDNTRRLWHCIAQSGQCRIQRLSIVIATSEVEALTAAASLFYNEQKTWPGLCEAFEVVSEAVLLGFPGSLEFPDTEPCVIGEISGQGRVAYTSNEDTIVVFAAFRSPNMAAAVKHLRDDGMAHSVCAKLIKQVIGDMPAEDLPDEWVGPKAEE